MAKIFCGFIGRRKLELVYMERTQYCVYCLFRSYINLKNIIQHKNDANCYFNTIIY